MKTYKIIKGNSATYIENEINWLNEKYDEIWIHGGINNYGGYFTVLVSYNLTLPEKN